MSILAEIRRPPFYAVVYTSPPKGYDGPDFGEAASLLVALAAVQPGYLGFETDQAAEKRAVVVCYWDSYAAMAEWRERAGEWAPAKPGLDAFLCTTGCLWPWQFDERQARLETAARSVA